MHTNKPGFVFHPILFFLFPVISLFAHNVVQVHVRETFRVLCVGLLFTGRLQLFLSWLTQSWHRAGMVVWLLLGLFFRFGHIYAFIHQAFPAVGILGQANVLATLWAAVMMLGVWAILHLLRPLPGLSQLLNVMSAALVLINAANLVAFNVRTLSQGGSRSEASATSVAGKNTSPSARCAGSRCLLHYV